MIFRKMALLHQKTEAQLTDEMSTMSYSVKKQDNRQGSKEEEGVHDLYTPTNIILVNFNDSCTGTDDSILEIKPTSANTDV
jgi:hypothetical protein